MSISLTLYNTNSPANKLVKNLDTQLFSDTGYLRGECSVLHPDIVLEFSGQQPIKCNYAHILEYGRYYFIRDITIIRTGLYEMHLDVDPLMTYADTLKTQKVISHRSTGHRTNYEYDPNIRFYTPKKTHHVDFDNMLSTQHILLTVAGGVTNA